MPTGLTHPTVVLAALTPTTTSVTSSLNPSALGDLVTFTATVRPLLSGTVQFQIDGVAVGGPVTLNGQGRATFSTSSLRLGDHPVVVVYRGDPTYEASSSPTLTQTVGRTPTATILTTSLNPSALGDAVIFTAAVNPPTVTGNVQFEVDGVSLGASPLAGGVATFSISTLTAGVHAVVASYGGSVTYEASSGALTQIVNGPVPTATSVTSSLNPSALGDLVTFTATVSPPTVTGNVQFEVDGVSLGGPVTLDATGRARLTTSTLTPGEHTVVASYFGNVNYEASTSPTLTQTVGSTTATGPAAPTDLRATLLASPTRVSLTWRDNATNEVNFALERSADGGPFTGLATVAARNGTGRQVTFVDTTVAADSTYRYRVAAVNAAGPSAFSNTVTVVLPSLPGTPTIASLTAARQSDKERVTVTWNNVAGETGYTIQWSTSSTFAIVAGSRTAPANATRFTTRDIERRTWWFRVGATNAAGTVWSAAVRVAAPPQDR